MTISSKIPMLSILLGLSLPVQAAPADVTAGKTLVTINCARCHAVGVDGASAHPQAPPFRQIVTRYPLDNLEEALAEGIMSGHPDMPEFVFNTEEIHSILAYLATLKSASEAGSGAVK